MNANVERTTIRNYHAVPTNGPTLTAFLFPRHQSLATHATAAEPEGLDDLGADQAVGRRLAPATTNPSSVAREALRRQTPKVGAICPNWARMDLCGGREVTRVPTAINICSPRVFRLLTPNGH